MKVNPAVACTMIAVGGYLLSTIDAVAIVGVLPGVQDSPFTTLLILFKAGIGCILLGYGIRFGLRRTPDNPPTDPPTVQPLDRPPPTDYSTLPGYPPAPPERERS